MSQTVAYTYCWCLAPSQVDCSFALYKAVSGFCCHAGENGCFLILTLWCDYCTSIVRHFQTVIWIQAFVWLTFSRWCPCACVQSALIPRRPGPSRCLSGYPGERHSWTSCESNVFGCFVWNYFWSLPEEKVPEIKTNAPNVTSLFTLSAVDKKIKSLLEELSVGASPGAVLQMSSLWAGILWRVPQTHSRQRAHSYNTWSRGVDRIITSKHDKTNKKR